MKKRTMKKLALVTAAMTLASSMSGVALAEEAEHRVKVGWNYSITSLSPFQAESPAKNALRSVAAFETLCAYDENAQLQNVMAKNWEQTDADGYEFKVEMYDYIYDTAGNNIKAEDAVYCMELLKAGGQLAAIFNKMESVTAIDDYTLQIKMFTNEYGDIQDALNYSFVVSKAAMEACGDEMATNLIATGPYMVEGFVNSSSVTFVANENYWQTDESLFGPTGKQNVDVIEMSCITESSQQEIALETGTIDFGMDMPGKSITQLQDNEAIDYEIFPAPNQYFLYLSADGPLADQKLRQAVCYAIDAAAVNQAAYENTMTLSNFGMSTCADYNEAWSVEDYYSYNPEKAMELIKEAGAEGTKLKILATGTGVTMSELFQAYLMQVGFDVELVNLELATYLTYANSDPSQYDIVTITPTGASNIQLWKVMLDSRNYNGTTVNGFKDDKLQELIETAGSIEGHTQENMDALYDYSVEQAYLYSPFGMSSVHMWRNDTVIKDVAVMYGAIPYLGGFTYTWNE